MMHQDSLEPAAIRFTICTYLMIISLRKNKFMGLCHACISVQCTENTNMTLGGVNIYGFVDWY